MSSNGTQDDALPRTLPDESVAADTTPGIAGTILARRYRMQGLLGTGGHAEVWDADDLLTRERVAVKLLRKASTLSAARARREIAILRVLRVPGVVRLIDDGVDDGRAFLVMERVEGAPFPGLPVGATWDDVRAPTLGLLETLGRIHAAGVVHRDLKPANVLVNRSARPTVLDFGLSHVEETATSALTQDREMLGTPLYLAPEQINGDPVTPRTDLYAVGVMLYQALTGRVPHEAPDLARLMRARLMQRPRPVRDLAPDVPQGVADVIARLLAVPADERPRSAGEVIALLRGEHVTQVTSFPRLGGDETLMALRASLANGRAVDLTGAHGSGRSRLLAQAGEWLAAQGRRVVYLPSARRAFASLAPLTGDVTPSAHASLAVAIEAMETRVRDALRDGVVVLVDDVDRIDAESASVLARTRSFGAMARVSTGDATADSLHVAPLSEHDLQALFAGPDRIMHFREDAARALFIRTDGNAERVVHEVEAWVRAGLCRWDGDRVVIARDGLDRLDGGMRLAPSVPEVTTPALPSHLQELLLWVTLAWPESSPSVLADAMGEPLWRVEAELQQLCTHGAARTLSDGRIEPRVLVAIDDHWPFMRRAEADRALARVLPHGSPSRLAHLVACANGGPQDAVETAAEAESRSRRLARDGVTGKAIVALLDGLRALRDAGVTGEHVESLMSLWVEIAIEEGTSAALDRVLYEISRIEPPSLHLRLLEALVRAALGVNVWTARALDEVEAVPAFADPALERTRQSVRVLAARRASLEREERVLADLMRMTLREDSAVTRNEMDGWLGRLRYRQGRFEEAAVLQEAAATVASRATARIAALLNAASAYMEAFRFDDAGRLARQANELARACRHAFLEARSEWILRSVAYRSGEVLIADRELLNAVSQFSSPHLESTIALCEAAIAFRRNDFESARDFATHAHRLWTDAGESLGAMLAAGLVQLVSPDEGRGDLEAVAARAAACPVPGVGIQVLGLLARSGFRAAVANETIDQLAATVPREHWSRRMEVLSVAESIAALG